jgi:hypothetical protein
VDVVYATHNIVDLRMLGEGTGEPFRVEWSDPVGLDAKEEGDLARVQVAQAGGLVEE